MFHMRTNVHHLITYYPKSSGKFNADSQMVIAYKNGNSKAIDHFEGLLWDWISPRVNDYTLLMAIPSSQAGKVNTITRTCRDLSRKSPWLIDATDMICKTKSHDSFCRTGQRDAFTLADSLAVSSEVAGHNILLIDDVTSTGISMFVCEKLLLAAGAASVTCLAIALTYKIYPFAFSNENANFYIQLKGDNAGKPLKTPIANCIGIVANADIFLPEYLYYLFLAIFNSGLYRKYIRGSVVPYIRQSDIALAVRDWFCRGA